MSKHKGYLEEKFEEMFDFIVDREKLNSGDISKGDQSEVYGKHNPELTTFIANQLIQEGFTVADISYHHDATDSLQIGDYQVFLPNSTVSDTNKEKFSHYYITLANGDTLEGSEPIYVFTELVEILKLKISDNG